MPSILNPDALSGDKIDSSDARTPSDQVLIKLIAQGDDPALAVLYKKHSGPVFNYLLRLVNEREVAEDLLQEVFVAVWQGAVRFGSRSSVKTWVFSIAHHQAVSWLRRNSRARHNDDPTDLELPADPETQAQVAWNREQVQIALKSLSAVHRAVVELSFVQGLSYAEIAEVMACPLGTVKSRMSYAMRHLQQILIRQDVEG